MAAETSDFTEPRSSRYRAHLRAFRRICATLGVEFPYSLGGPLPVPTLPRPGEDVRVDTTRVLSRVKDIRDAPPSGPSCPATA